MSNRFRLAFALALLVLCLLGDSAILGAAGRIGLVFEAVGATLYYPETQWIVYTCAVWNLLILAALRMGVRREGATLSWFWETISAQVWIVALVASASLRYAFEFERAARSMHALTFVGAAVFGQGVALLIGKDDRADGNNRALCLVIALIAVLASAALWKPGIDRVFEYRNQVRWCGAWGNPNTFGVLMGVGTVLALGMAVSRIRLMVEGCRLKVAAFRSRISNFCFLLLAALSRRRSGSTFFFFLASAVMGIGLVKSYSRGAWVGTAVGLTLLLVQGSGFKVQGSRLRAGGSELAEEHSRAWPCLALIAVSVAVLAFWNLRDSQWLPARRAVSAANANDFSWRNRVAAWEGALQMMAEKPWFGFGWNQPERVYDSLYRSSKVPEGAAIQLNDYFTLGTTLGIPALLCFINYVGLSLIRHPPPVPRHSPPVTCHSPRATAYWSRAVCRAGAVVLLVGFWFDGGLFKLATAAPFWILLELGREDFDTDGTNLHG